MYTTFARLWIRHLSSFQLSLQQLFSNLQLSCYQWQMADHLTLPERASCVLAWERPMILPGAEWSDTPQWMANLRCAQIVKTSQNYEVLPAS